MAKLAKPKAGKERVSVSDQEALYARIQGEIEEVQREAGIAGGESAPAVRLSTGLLAYDLMVGGGLLPGGWHTFFGPEQSAKSTLAMQCMISAVACDYPNPRFYDYEGSTGSDTSYLANQMRVNGLKLTIPQLLGARDKDGKLIQKGKVWYTSNITVLEDFFETEARILRRLPDKLFLNGKWWLCFDNDKHGMAMLQGKHDAQIKRQYNKLAIQAVDGRGQGVVICDSYSAMLPKSLDDDKKSGAGMAAKARAFAEMVPKIQSKLMTKRVMMLGVNQLRLRPAVMFGDPAYEPNGEALKFASNVRIRNTPRSVQGGQGQYERESSWDGSGEDVYRYIHSRAIKNKTGGVPNSEAWARIWVKDKKGRGNGFDPVYDTFQYLLTTGQLTGGRNKLLLEGPIATAKKALKWQQFKTLVLGGKDEAGEILRWCGAIKKGETPFKIRDRCRKQLTEGDGFERFFTKQATKEEAEED